MFLLTRMSYLVNNIVEKSGRKIKMEVKAYNILN